jgi:putative glutamine amidotransferase
VSGRPVVGICAAIERARWAAWDVDVNLVQRAYTDALERAGASGIILPATETGAGEPDALLDLLDALILSGGADLDPASYGAEPDEHTRGARLERDRFELTLCTRAIERDTPLLGVCRGMEVLNVALGGDLVQHLDTVKTHLHTPGEFSDHEVVLEPGSLAARAEGAERILVRSHHHQGIGRLGEGLRVTGRASDDGVVEAVELEGHRFGLGILWHTEEEERSAIVRALVEATRVPAHSGGGPAR